MNFEEVLRKRHSIRRFEEKEVGEEKIKKILELANLSPSAGNLQAGSVVIVKDKEIKEKISQAALGQDFIVEAAVVFVVCANLEESAQKYGKRGRELYAIQDATIFASYLQLAVTSFGLGSCWIGAFEESEVSEILKLPKEMRPIAIILVGEPAEKPYLTRRKNLDEIIYKEY
jgi:nitroreductase